MSCASWWATRCCCAATSIVADLYAHLDHVRAATRQPVSTAEPWHVWMRYPELADHVDYIAVHMLPYWEGVEVEAAVEYVVGKMQLLQQTFPGKQIVIGEVGWPSDGRTRESAVASTSNEALFLRRFLARARKEGYVYYVMEAFDQPWKARVRRRGRRLLGRVRRRIASRSSNSPQPIVRMPQWHVLAAASVVTRGGAAVAVLFPQPHAAQPRPQLPRHGRVRHGHAGGVDPVRLSRSST